MACWNFKMEEAPRGLEGVQITKDKNGVEREKPTFTSQKLWLTDGKDMVSLSQWLPKEGRWEGFTKNGKDKPVAWQPFYKPEPPTLT